MMMTPNKLENFTVVLTRRVKSGRLWTISQQQGSGDRPKILGEQQSPVMANEVTPAYIVQSGGYAPSGVQWHSPWSEEEPLLNN